MVIERTMDEVQAMTPDLTISREFDAPRDLVWQVWTQPEHVVEWWWPRGFSAPHCEIDLRPGGELRIDMVGPDGPADPMLGTFHEVDEPERLVYTGRAIPNEDGTAQLEVLTVVTFSETDGKTTVTMEATVVRATETASFALAGMEQGWVETLDKLGEYLPTLVGSSS